jgi:hypothetical protein
VVRGLRRICVLSTVAVVMLAASASQAVIASGGGAPSSPTAAGTQPVAEVGFLSGASQSQTVTQTATRRDHQVRATRQLHAASAAAPAVASRVKVSSAAAHESSLLANFDGAGSLDSEITNFGAKFEPPDQGLCAGNGFVVDMVNSAYRVYDTKGETLAGPFNINKVFNDGFLEFTSDPRCWYDPATKTWIAVILFINDASTASRIDIGVTSDPTGDWTSFRIDTTHPGGPGCPCFGDQPTLGFDSSNIYVTTNEFSILGPEFNGAQIYAISKRDLVRRAKKVHFVHFTNLFIGDAQAASVQPALTTGPSRAEYFLSSLDPNGTGDTRIGVWALTNVGAVSSGHAPRLSSQVIASEPYAIPPPALQKGSTSTLDSGDDRMQQVQFIGGEIWGELDTTVVPEGDTAPRAGAAWFRVKPRLDGSVLAGAHLDAQGYVVSEGEYVLYPAIQADLNGHAAMVFTLTSSERFASAAYTVLSEDGSDFGEPRVAAAGTGPYDAKATRWGDYSFAVLDPAGDSVWVATEYIPPASSQTTTGRRNWGTRVLQISLESRQGDGNGG